MKNIYLIETDYNSNKPLKIANTVGLLLSLIMLLFSCGKDGNSTTPIDRGDEVRILDGDFPRFLNLPPGGDNGAYDATVATDPATKRVWMVFSRVTGPTGSGRVSTHLAYSDDGGFLTSRINTDRPQLAIYLLIALQVLSLVWAGFFSELSKTGPIWMWIYLLIIIPLAITFGHKINIKIKKTLQK